MLLGLVSDFELLIIRDKIYYKINYYFALNEYKDKLLPKYFK